MRVVFIAAVLVLAPATTMAQVAPFTGPIEPPAYSDCNRAHQFYPATAARERREGTTTLSFRVGIDGRTNDVGVAESSGSRDLDAAAVAAVRCWRYEPATKDGTPVEVQWQAKVSWKLPSESWLDRLFR